MLFHAEDKVKLIDRRWFADLALQAKTSERKRINVNFHPTLEDNPHRFLNVLSLGTYICPHVHLHPEKSETFIVLSGLVAFYTFLPNGGVERCIFLGDASAAGHVEIAGTRHALRLDLLSGCVLGIDIMPGVIHTLAVLSESAVCFEVKPGPYMAATDKDFMGFAPREKDPASAQYLEQLLRQAIEA